MSLAFKCEKAKNNHGQFQHKCILHYNVDQCKKQYGRQILLVFLLPLPHFSDVRIRPSLDPDRCLRLKAHIKKKKKNMNKLESTWKLLCD